MTNQDAPDRIWIEEDDGCPYFYDASELAEAGGPLIEYIRADLTALRSTPPVGARVTGWQPIETAPHEELVVLGWQEDGVWKQEIALASAGERFPNGYSNRWTHGRATHWMPLPEPPAALLPAGEGK